MTKYLGASFPQDVRDVKLSGLSTATAVAITSTDNVLGALGKLQAQITSGTGGTSSGGTGSTFSILLNDAGADLVDDSGLRLVSDLVGSGGTSSTFSILFSDAGADLVDDSGLRLVSDLVGSGSEAFLAAVNGYLAHTSGLVDFWGVTGTLSMNTTTTITVPFGSSGILNVVGAMSAGVGVVNIHPSSANTFAIIPQGISGGTSTCIVFYRGMAVSST